MSCKIWLLIALVALTTGCIPPPAASSKNSGGAAAPPAAPAPSPPPAEQPAAPTERVVAEAGVGQKGRSLDEHEGLIVTPLKALLSTQERLTFEVQLKQALDLYEAQFGKPKSHEEYMSKVVEANGIKLPELPPGHRYVYDPQRGELMVERPAQSR